MLLLSAEDIHSSNVISFALSMPCEIFVLSSEVLDVTVSEFCFSTSRSADRIGIFCRTTKSSLKLKEMYNNQGTKIFPGISLTVSEMQDKILAPSCNH